MFKTSRETLLQIASFGVLLFFFQNPCFSSDAPTFLADRHTAKQIACEACHGQGQPSGEIQTDKCLACHGGSYAKLAEKTAGGDINYHETHMGEINCIECHQGHKPARLVCDQCHEFKATVP